MVKPARRLPEAFRQVRLIGILIFEAADRKAARLIVVVAVHLCAAVAQVPVPGIGSIVLR